MSGENWVNNEGQFQRGRECLMGMYRIYSQSYSVIALSMTIRGTNSNMHDSICNLVALTMFESAFITFPLWRFGYSTVVGGSWR